jgi:hypothetical protein
MPKKRALGKGLGAIMAEQGRASNKALGLSDASRAAQLARALREQRIKQIEKIPFKERFASPREKDAFYESMKALNQIEGLEVEGEHMGIAKVLLAKFRGQNQSKITKTDVKNALMLLKKYGPRRRV